MTHIEQKHVCDRQNVRLVGADVEDGGMPLVVLDLKNPIRMMLTKPLHAYCFATHISDTN